MRYLVCLFLFAAAPAYSQQSFSATYDTDRQIKLKGAVTRMDWVNPHAYLFINVQDAGGTITNWAVEFGDPLELEREGWKRSSLRIGDVVSVEGNPAKGDHKIAYATSVTLVASGKKLFVFPSRGRSSAAGPPPRWPDGQIRLGPPPGKRGYWVPASATALVESTSATIPMNKDGLLRNLADADRVAPTQT